MYVTKKAGDIALHFTTRIPKKLSMMRLKLSALQEDTLMPVSSHFSSISEILGIGSLNQRLLNVATKTLKRSRSCIEFNVDSDDISEDTQNFIKRTKISSCFTGLKFAAHEHLAGTPQLEQIQKIIQPCQELRTLQFNFCLVLENGMSDYWFSECTKLRNVENLLEIKS